MLILALLVMFSTVMGLTIALHEINESWKDRPPKEPKKKAKEKPVEWDAHLEIPSAIWYQDLCERVDQCKTLEELDKFDASDFQNKKKRQRELNAKANSLHSNTPIRRVKAQHRIVYDYQRVCYIEQTRLLDGSNRRMQRQMPSGFKPMPRDYTWRPVMANVSDHKPLTFNRVRYVDRFDK